MSKVIIFPTDTVYGIGCSVFDKEGINRIYNIKHRDRNKPLSVLCLDRKQIEEIAYLDIKAAKIVDLFLPGPLTIILKAKDNVKESLGFDTVGVRIPDSRIALDILAKNGPMSTTSVNESGEVPLNEYLEIVEAYANLVDEIYDRGNEKNSNKASTVIKIDNNKIEMIREGEITLEEILKYYV